MRPLGWWWRVCQAGRYRKFVTWMSHTWSISFWRRLRNTKLCEDIFCKYARSVCGWPDTKLKNVDPERLDPGTFTARFSSRIDENLMNFLICLPTPTLTSVCMCVSVFVFVHIPQLVCAFHIVAPSHQASSLGFPAHRKSIESTDCTTTATSRCVGSGGSNAGPHTWTVRALPTKSSP